MTVAIPYAMLKDVSTTVRESFNSKTRKILVDDFTENMILSIPDGETIFTVKK